MAASPSIANAVESIRGKLTNVAHFVALEGTGEGWIDYEATLTGSEPSFEKPEIAEGDLLTINYTSGTTARPKGVMITHRNAYMNAIGTLVHHHLSPADRYLWTLPMFHANGWTFTWINTARGMTHVCLRRVEPKAIYQLIKDERITMLCAAPTVLISIANAPADIRANAPRGVRLFTAGAPPAAATIELVERELGWELTQVYGLTETAPLITVCEPLPEHQTLSLSERAQIKARQGVELVTSGELKVVAEDGQEVPHDGQTLGEIAVRGNVVMKGYYNDPEATSAAIRNGWFYSGDAAVVHPDGYVEIRDRFKDVIISGGENISSVEIEGCLLRHPAVQEVAVVGMPHERWGESPHAFVILRQGAQATENELKLHVREALASGQDVVMRVDVQGAETVKGLLSAAITIFLICESEEELVARLRARRTESEEALQKRLQTAHEEMACIPDFDYVVVNRHGALDDAVDDVVAIMRAEHCRSVHRRIQI